MLKINYLFLLYILLFHSGRITFFQLHFLLRCTCFNITYEYSVSIINLLSLLFIYNFYNFNHITYLNYFAKINKFNDKA